MVGFIQAYSPEMVEPMSAVLMLLLFIKPLVFSVTTTLMVLNSLLEMSTPLTSSTQLGQDLMLVLRMILISLTASS
jgi:hypothetical protein